VAVVSADGSEQNGAAVVDPGLISRIGGDRRSPADLRALREAETTRAACARCGWEDDRERSLRDARAAFKSHPCTAGPVPTKRDGRAKDKATRTEAIERMSAGTESASKIARDLGIGTNTVLRWSRDASSGPRQRVSTPQ
jgi:DNA invertase Pin-like site-specific DNA recombinase